MSFRLWIYARIGREKDMEISVKRGPSVQGATIGELSVDGVPECLTLEDEVRQVGNGTGWTHAENWVQSWKIQNVTAIPRGRYRVIITFSEHFGCSLPRLLNVPGFTFVRIHWGNKAADTDGCLLVGQTKEGNLIYKSRDAFKALFPKIQAAIKAGQEVWVTVA